MRHSAADYLSWAAGLEANGKSKEMRTGIIAIVALVVGAVIVYVYKQGEVTDLAKQVSALETQVADATEKAAAAAATEIDALKADLAAKIKLTEDQKAKITELDTALKKATSPASPATPPSTPQ
jgi:uncharacterized membrane protein